MARVERDEMKMLDEYMEAQTDVVEVSLPAVQSRCTVRRGFQHSTHHQHR